MGHYFLDTQYIEQGYFFLNQQKKLTNCKFAIYIVN